MKDTKFDKTFNYGIGCIGLVGILATVITLFVAITQPTQVIAILQQVIGQTPTPVYIVVTREAGSNTIPTQLPTYTPLPTCTPAPTYTPFPTYASSFVVVTATFPSPTISPQPTFLFQDNFNAGLSPYWQVVSGNPFIVNDMLTASQDTWLSIGDNTWRNYTVEFQAYAADCWFSGGYNAIALRVQDMSNFIAFIWARCESAWYIVENDNWNEVPNSRSGTVGHDMLSMAITAEGGRFTAYVNGGKISSFYDTRFPQGRIAFQVGAKTQIDDFQIREIQP